MTYTASSVTRIEYLQHARIIAKPTLAALVVWFNPFLTRVLLALTVRGFLAICLQLIHNIIIPATKREWRGVATGYLTCHLLLRSSCVCWRFLRERSVWVFSRSSCRTEKNRYKNQQCRDSNRGPVWFKVYHNVHYTTSYTHMFTSPLQLYLPRCSQLSYTRPSCTALAIQCVPVKNIIPIHTWTPTLVFPCRFIEYYKCYWNGMKHITRGVGGVSHTVGIVPGSSVSWSWWPLQSTQSISQS